jgi:hypothetical protein
VLRDLLREIVQVIRDPFGILCLLEMPRGASAELEARGEALQAEHVFEREDRTRLGHVIHRQGCVVVE